MTSQIRPEDRECPLSATLDYVGEWWTLLILHDCFDGYTRFEQFRQNIGLSTSMLTRRLRTLVERGVLERRQYQAHPPRDEYLLTDLGRSLRPVLVVMAAWRNAQLPPAERAMILVDAASGREVTPVVVDAASGEPVATDSQRFVFAAGPAAGPIMRERYAERGQQCAGDGVEGDAAPSGAGTPARD